MAVATRVPSDTLQAELATGGPSPNVLLPEVPIPGELFGFERLAASAGYWSTRERDAGAIAAGIWADVLAWSGESPDHDDMTLLVVRVSARSHGVGSGPL
ncbi:MAG: hypothetical protein HY329_21315 [Chloroflexi bacterium]|nr:hypothetical protein [Chloroflexota bacterium]